MHAFHQKEEQLYCEGVSLHSLAKKLGTPLYVYSSDTILQHYQRLEEALAPLLDHHICYAVKANSNKAILELLTGQGAGFDIVSGGELFKVINAGGKAADCTFAGVGKTAEEIAYALHEGIYSFNVESEEELLKIEEVAASLGKKAPVALRVNPNVDAPTHEYITTGKNKNKFGIGVDRAAAVYAHASTLPHLQLKGIQTHIGSQITTPAPFREALEKLLPLVKELRERYQLEFFSIGGGLGIVYEEAPASAQKEWWNLNQASATPIMTAARYAEALVPLLQGLNMRILIEPGRFLVGNAGVLVTEVLYRKSTPTKKFIIVDAGMNDLIRPALYQGYHEIVPLQTPQSEEREVVDVVGPVCESGDFFAQERSLPLLEQGDLLAIMSSGAYGFTMASTYNARPLSAEVLVEEEKAFLVRRRQTWKELIEGEYSWKEKEL